MSLTYLSRTLDISCIDCETFLGWWRMFLFGYCQIFVKLILSISFVDSPCSLSATIQGKNRNVGLFPSAPYLPHYLINSPFRTFLSIALRILILTAHNSTRCTKEENCHFLLNKYNDLSFASFVLN